jgi:hypothetical protein
MDAADVGVKAPAVGDSAEAEAVFGVMEELSARSIKGNMHKAAPRRADRCALAKGRD